MSDNQSYILSIGIAHNEAQKASDNHDYQQMKYIWESIEADPCIIGDNDDYHNLSVVYSQVDDYLTAYKVVQRGLQQFPYNTDLLADAIYYGSNCQKYKECKEHMAVLLKRPRASWTWRAFSFLIDYLTQCWDWEEDIASIESMLSNALVIARQYQNYLPNQERSYVAEYEVLNMMSKFSVERGDNVKAQEQKDDALKILRETVYGGRIAAIQCALRYIDFMFENQQFQEVIKIANQAMNFGQATPSARLGYFMYLSAQSREMLLYEDKDWRNHSDEILNIYSEYLAAFSSDISRTYKDNIKNRVTILSARSSVPAPQYI